MLVRSLSPHRRCTLRRFGTFLVWNATSQSKSTQDFLEKPFTEVDLDVFGLRPLFRDDLRPYFKIILREVLASN